MNPVRTMKAVTARELRERLGEYLDRAQLSGDVFVVTRKGRGKAVIVGAQQFLGLLDRLEALENGDRGPEHDTEDQEREREIRSKEELKALIS